MLYRKIINTLNQWAKEEDRKPLILRGARQVGKTTAINIFSKNFDHYISLNLEKKEDAQLFEKNLPVDELIRLIFFTQNIAFSTNKKVLLFIDEIQASPPALAMMRYFYEYKALPELYVAAAGSLLEAVIGEHQISFPVGRVRYMFMYPLTFEEFLVSSGEDEAVKCYHQIPMPDYAFSKLLKLFHKYVLIGGMPEIVKTYIKNEDIVSLTPIYQGLMTAYLDDVSKYARSPAMVDVIRHAIEAAPFEAGRRIKFQGFGQSNYKSREMGEALRTLERSMLLYLIYPTTVTEPPIKPDRKKSPRLQFLDTGLLNYCAGLQGHFFNFDDLHSFYQGTIAKHIVGQELMGLDADTPKKIAFWVREQKQSNAELDFVVPYRHYAVPLEVKAGKTGSLRSLHQFVDRSPHEYALRLYAGPLQISEVSTMEGKPFKLLDVPYFLTGKINEYIQRFVEETS
ncbi:MAG: ATP-binding protein [bacterium]|nr:ATP-binding protein [bacterium]